MSVQLKLWFDVVSKQRHPNLEVIGSNSEIIDDILHELQDEWPVASLNAARGVHQEHKVRLRALPVH